MKKEIKSILSISPLSVYNSFQRKRRVKISKKNTEEILAAYLLHKKCKKLQIGCGTNLIPGWLNSDINTCEGTVFLDAGKIFPIPSEIFDFVFSEHLFEHLNIVQQKNMLDESFRILKKGGVLRIATPSLDFLTDLYLNPFKPQNKKYTEWAVENIPGLFSVKLNVNDEKVHNNYVINHFFKAWGHQMIHNYGSMKSLALATGFSEVNQKEVGRSEFPELQGIEKHGIIIPEEMNEIETMVVELKK